MPQDPSQSISFLDSLINSFLSYFLSDGWGGLRFKLQILGALISILFLAGIIVLEIKTQFFYSSYRRKLKNAFAPMYPRTDKVSGDIAYVEKLLGSGDPLKIKQAVILVDDVTASVFNILGYPDDFKGAVGYFKTYLHNAEEFLTDHDVIIALKNDKDKNKSLTKWEAEKIIKNYKQALQDLQAL